MPLSDGMLKDLGLAPPAVAPEAVERLVSAAEALVAAERVRAVQEEQTRQALTEIRANTEPVPWDANVTARDVNGFIKTVRLVPVKGEVT